MTKARDLADLLDASGNIIAQGTIDGRDIASDGSKLDSIEHGATGDQTHSEIRALITAGVDTNVFTDADHSKLDGIEAGATADQTAAEIKTAYESNANTNEFSDAEQSKLAGIETGATGDQTASEIRSLVEAATDSNVFTDADHNKLNAIEAGATADQTKADIDALNVDADTLDGQHGSYYTSYADTAVANIVDSAPGTLDTLNELAAALGDDPNFATTTATNIGTKANKTITVSAGSGLTGGGDLTANRTISHADTSSQASLTALTGAAVVSDIDVDTYGHVTGLATRNITLANLGYTGETNATADQTAAEIRTLVEAATDSNVFTDADHTKLNGIEASADVTDTANVVAALTAGTNVTIAANGTISSTDTNTVYTHPTHPGDDFSVDTGALTGATVVSDIDINVTTDSLGHVTDANGSVATRTLTLANLGYTGATNANYITNNNQLTNGAGYTTNVGDITNVTAGTNLTGGGSSGSVTVNLTASPNITSLNVGGSEVVSSSRALKNIASVDATTVATLNAGGVGGGGFEPTTASGTSQTLNLGSSNFFEGGTLTGNTTVSFSNVPTEARWQYSYIPGALATGWDLSVGLKKVVNANVLQSSSSGFDVFFKPDGTRMYVCQGSKMEEYNLSTAWDITTATYSRAKTTTQNGTFSKACYFHPNGTYFWQADSSNRYLARWTMSTAWDVSTAYASQIEQPQYTFGYGGMFFKTDGTRVYLAGEAGRVDAFDLSTPWDTTAGNGFYSRSDTFQPGGSGSSVVGLHFKSDGTKMYVARKVPNSKGFVQEYNLSTAWVISTATSSGATYNFTDADNVEENQGLYIRDESGNSGINVYFSNVQGTNAGNMNHYNMALANTITLPSSVDGILPTDNPVSSRRTIDFVTTNGGTDVRIIGVEDIDQ